MLKFNFLKKSVAFLAIAAAAVSCNQEMGEVTPVSGKHLVSFNVEEGVTTRGAITTSIEEFYVYATDSQGEVVMDGVKYTNESGKWAADQDLFTDEATLNFYVYAPTIDRDATKLTYDMSEDVTKQPDLMVVKVESADTSKPIELKFERALALIQFKISGECVYSLEQIAVSGIVDNGVYNIADGSWANEAATSTSYFAGIKEGYTDGSNLPVITDETGYLMVIPQSTEGVSINVMNTNGTEKEYEVDANWEAGKLYTYTIGINGIEPEETIKVTDDYTSKKPSNCYIVNPTASGERVYLFPVQERVNDYWGNYANYSSNKVSNLDGLTVNQLWSDCSAATGLDVTLVMDTNNKVAMQVVVPAGYSNMGNELYAVKKNGNTIWSWHLWVTDYAPTGDRLNRYVGQKLPISISGALLYQFGRKDPFRSTARISNSSATIKSGVLNPTTAYYASQYDWATDFDRSVYWGDKELTTSGKSIFDPSPYGYRVADYTHMRQYNNLGDFEVFGSYYIDTFYNTYFCFTTGFATDYGPITNKEARVWMSNPNGYSMGNNASTYRMYDYTSLYGPAYVFETANYAANAFFPVFSIAE